MIDDDQPAEYAFDAATLHVVFSVKRDTPDAGDPASEE